MSLNLGCDGRSRIEEEAGDRAFVRDDLQHPLCQFDQSSGGKVFFAHLDEIDAPAGPQGCLLDESGLALQLIAGKKHAVGNGAAKHVDKFSRRRDLRACFDGGKPGTRNLMKYACGSFEAAIVFWESVPGCR